jgi:glycosyltransferase involved in cell wall biosynthesis
VLEATLGGTRRYLEDIAVTTAGTGLVQGLAYGTSRADAGFHQLLDLVQESGWFLQPVESMRRPIAVVDDARSVERVRRAMRSFKPDVLHVHSAKGGAVGRIAGLTHGPHAPRVVYSPHALPSRLGAGYMAVERGLSIFTNRFVAVSDSERRQIVDEGIADKNCVDVVYPRIDTKFYRPRDRDAARRELGLPADVPIVVGVGRLASQKNPLNFVHAIARLRAVYPAVTGVWVGDGELRAEVERAAAQYDLGQALQITGWISDIRPYIAASDVLLSTSRYESFGYVIPETFAMERPAVASSVVGTIDVFFPAAEQLLYPPEDLDRAVEMLKRVLADAGLRSELGRLGRLSVIERFSSSAMRTALCTSYDKALEPARLSLVNTPIR